MMHIPAPGDEKEDAPAFGSASITRDEVVAISFSDNVSLAGADSWDISADQDGSVLAWTEKVHSGYRLYIAGIGGVAAPKDSSYLFADYRNVASIEFNGCFHTDGVTNMSYMFYRCYVLQSINAVGFDTSSVTDMSYMFAVGRSIDTKNNSRSKLWTLDVSSFDTSNVTNMEKMFANCDVLASLNLSSFDMSKVTNTNGMFEFCNKLKITSNGYDFSSLR